MSETISSIFQEFNSSAPPEPFWENCNKTVIYGAGNTGKEVFRILRNNGIHISCFLDQKAKPGSLWEGVPVYNPKDIQLSEAERQRANVIVAIHNRDVEMPPIFELLRTYCFSRIISFIELFDYFGSELGDRYWLTSRLDYKNYQLFLEEVDNLWADDASRILYRAIIKFRLTGKYEILPEPDMENQYFPQDLSAWQAPHRFVDCGAFDGDTLSYMVNKGIPIESVVAFEPDPNNFKKLNQFVNNNQENIRDISSWPCGVYSSTKQMHFSSAQGEASFMTAKGDVVIQCVSLDEVIPCFAPTLIKMDIEGAEYEALLGARDIISKYKPGLAISLYHRPADLWQIPLLINELTGGRGVQVLPSTTRI